MGEPADGAVEKILLLIELDDVMAWDGVRHDSIPGLVLLRVKLAVHGTCPSWRVSGGMSETPRIDTEIQLQSRDQKQAGILPAFGSARGEGVHRWSVCVCRVTHTTRSRF